MADSPLPEGHVSKPPTMADTEVRQGWGTWSPRGEAAWAADGGPTWRRALRSHPHRHPSPRPSRRPPSALSLPPVVSLPRYTHFAPLALKPKSLAIPPKLWRGKKKTSATVITHSERLPRYKAKGRCFTRNEMSRERQRPA